MADEKKPFKKNNKFQAVGKSALGKLPPQALEFEEAVLGAIMLDKDAIAVVIDILSFKSFYSEAHQLIYKSMTALFEESSPIDMLTVAEKLKAQGAIAQVGGPAFIAMLTNKVASTANIEYHARIVSQKYIQRSLIATSSDVIKKAYEDTSDVFDLLDQAEQGLFEITQNNMSRGTESLNTLLPKVQRNLEEISKKEDGLTGTPSGFMELDALTSGWQPSDLIILAARPGMGKTSFTLALAQNAAKDFNKPVAIFSLEMSKEQLASRLLSMESEVPIHNLRDGKLEDYQWEKLNSVIERMSNDPIHIDDTPGLNIFELRAKCRRLKQQHDIQLIIIDYLQLMSGGGDKGGGNREQEISAISRGLKSLAKEIHVPVIALSQLSRAVETRGGTKRPLLSDLRESGAIEQDADMVTFIYRPEYYGIEEDEEGRPMAGVAELIIAKNRHGSTPTIEFKFVKEFAKFVNKDDGDLFQLGSGGNDTAIPQMNSDSGIIKASKLNDDDLIPF